MFHNIQESLSFRSKKDLAIGFFSYPLNVVVVKKHNTNPIYKKINFKTRLLEFNFYN